MFGLRAQELYVAAKINYLSKSKEDIASKIAMMNCKRILTQLHQVKLRCEQAIKCRENAIELIEMGQVSIIAKSRTAYEGILLEINQPIKKIVTELLAAPSVGDILGNGGEIPRSRISPLPQEERMENVRAGSQI
jgi:hypothetical protein